MTAAARAATISGDRSGLDALAKQADSAARNVAALTNQMRAASRAMSGSAMQAASQQMSGLSAEVTRLGGAFGAMADRILPNWRIVFTASVAGAALALGKLATSAAKSLDDLDDMASATGTTTEKIEALQLVAAKSGEQGFENINKALERTTRAMGQSRIEAAKLGPTIQLLNGKVRNMADPFEAVGIDPRLFKDSISLMEAWANALDRVRDPSMKAAIASDLLGKGWARQLPILKNLRAEMEAAQREIQAGGGFTSEQTIEQGNRFIAVMARLEGLFTRLRNVAGAQLGEALIPALQGLIAFVEKNADQIKAWTQQTAAFIGGVTKDLINFLTVGETRTQTQFGANIINAMLYIQNTAIPGLVAAFNLMMAPLNAIAQSVNSIFGTQMTGGQIGLALAIGQVSGAFGVMTTAINVAAAALLVLAPVLGPAGWIIVGLTAINVILLTVTNSWGDLTKAIKSAWDTIASIPQAIWDKLKALGSNIANMPAPAGGVGKPMASGGLIPGSGNRDSFPAWLMPGEFVIRKSIVSALGADFFAGLNRGMGSLLPRNQYATGGLVVAEPPGGGQPVHLHIGGNSFPLNGAPSVVSALVVEAHRQHVRSAGVKPSWYGGR